METTGRNGFLCELLGCEPDELTMLDAVKYDWAEVMREFTDWESKKISMLDFNGLMRAVCNVGRSHIEQAVKDKIMEAEEATEKDGLDNDGQQVIAQLQQLNPWEDINSYHNYLDSHVWFEQNEDIYRAHLSGALEEFEHNTGLKLGEQERDE